MDHGQREARSHHDAANILLPWVLAEVYLADRSGQDVHCAGTPPGDERQCAAVTREEQIPVQGTTSFFVGRHLFEKEREQTDGGEEKGLHTFTSPVPSWYGPRIG